MIATGDPPPLLDAHGLHRARHDDPDIVILDASWHLPDSGRDAGAEHRDARIPGARFFDIDAISDPAAPLPHMAPSAADFARAVGALSVKSDSHVVCYDRSGLFSATRAWWMFRLFGHDRVSLLDGGFAAWQQAGLETASGPPDSVPVLPAHDPRSFRARLRPELVRDEVEVRAGLTGDDGPIILDARSPGRFAGREPEPRKGLRAGHIPGSRNLPWQALLDPETGHMRPVADLAERFAEAGIHPGKGPVVASCGSGITACTLAFGLFLLGDDSVAVYDGSWTEWGGRADLPIETGDGSSGRQGS